MTGGMELQRTKLRNVPELRRGEKEVKVGELHCHDSISEDFWTADCIKG
jgi:hypothetical protein